MARAGAALTLLLLALLAVVPGEAHKGVTTKFTYNADLYPVFLNRCGRCHIENGVGPMSLLKYDEAFPWGEAIRAELLSAYGDVSAEARSTTVDPHDFVKAAHRQISARELDIVLDWVSGGTPEGDNAQTPAAVPLRVEWAEGEPNLIAKMPNPYQLSATALEATHESALSIPTATAVTVERVDLVPGTPAIVRSAVLTLRSPDGTTRLLGTWVPRQIPAALALKPPVRIDPGAHILARMHYKKTWKYEGTAMSDLSRVGLYVAD